MPWFFNSSHTLPMFIKPSSKEAIRQTCTIHTACNILWRLWRHHSCSNTQHNRGKQQKYYPGCNSGRSHRQCPVCHYQPYCNQPWQSQGYNLCNKRNTNKTMQHYEFLDSRSRRPTRQPNGRVCHPTKSLTKAENDTVHPETPEKNAQCNFQVSIFVLFCPLLIYFWRLFSATFRSKHGKSWKSRESHCRTIPASWFTSGS